VVHLRHPLPDRLSVHALDSTVPSKLVMDHAAVFLDMCSTRVVRCLAQQIVRCLASQSYIPVVPLVSTGTKQGSVSIPTIPLHALPAQDSRALLTLSLVYAFVM
jgi:hypothetical protein